MNGPGRIHEWPLPELKGHVLRWDYRKNVQGRSVQIALGIRCMTQETKQRCLRLVHKLKYDSSRIRARYPKGKQLGSGLCAKSRKARNNMER